MIIEFDLELMLDSQPEGTYAYGVRPIDRVGNTALGRWTKQLITADKAGSIVRRQLDELADIADDHAKRGKHLERMYAAFMRETAQIVTEHGHMLTEAQDAVDKMAKKGAEQNKATEQKF